MATTLLTIGMVTRKALQLFRNSNTYLKSIDRQHDAAFSVSGGKIGDNLKIRKPNQYTVRTGATAVPQETNEQSVTLTVATQKGVDVQFSSVERSLSLDDFSDRVLAPMVNRLAGAVASDVMTLAEQVPNVVHNVDGGNATLSPTAATWLQAGAILDQLGAPRAERKIILSPMTQARTVSSLSGLFNNQSKIGEQYSKGLMGMDVLGFNWYMDQTVIRHATAAFGALASVSAAANQTGSTIATTALAGPLSAGDFITFAGVYALNPVTKAVSNTLQQFVVTANAIATATSISIYPPIVPVSAGALATVSASPAAGATIASPMNASESYTKNLAFLPQAFTLVTADLQLPTAGVLGAHREVFDGISLRCIDDYNATTDFWMTRLDILYGFCAPRPEWCVIVADI